MARQKSSASSGKSSDTYLSNSAFLQSEAKMLVVRAEKDNFRKYDDVRWQSNEANSRAIGSPQDECGSVHQFGVPPILAWVQHVIRNLVPYGTADVNCMVALPGQLFYCTQIPVCLWFLGKKENAHAKRGFRLDSPLVVN